MKQFTPSPSATSAPTSSPATTWAGGVDAFAKVSAHVESLIGARRRRAAVIPLRS